MARGENEKVTDRQRRMAAHIAAGYAERGVPEEEAVRRAWATVNRQAGGRGGDRDSRAAARRGKRTQKAGG